MTQRQFLILVFICNILFLFIYIHKQNWIIQLSYAQQKNEKLLVDLQQHKKELFNRLQARKKHSAIKKTAQKNLHMNKVQLKNISQLPAE